MASTNFLPDREADLVAWSVNFNTLINAAPTDYGLTLAQAGDYTPLHDAFANAWQLSTQDSTRTPSLIVTKNEAEQALRAYARELAAIVQANPTTTDTQRADLGLTVPDPQPTPVPIPDTPPAITFNWVRGREINLRLRDASNPDRRGKPNGVYGATVLWAAGDAPPENLSEWTLYKTVTRITSVSVPIPTEVAAGTKVWVTGYWVNTRGEQGPAAEGISASISAQLPLAA